VAQAKTDKALTKSQIATHFAEKFGISRRQAVEILDEFANLAYSEAKKKGEFTVPGIGKLVKQNRKARTGRNPATGEAIKIPAKTVMKFRVAKAAKDAVLPAKKK
jgi:DNA-binding protein HU-beta